MARDDTLIESAPTRPAIWAAMVVGAASLLVTGIEPIILGGLVDHGRLSDAGLGQVATLETIGIAAGSAFGPFWVARGRMAAKTLIAALALAIANLLASQCPSAAWIMLDRALAGTMAGILLGSSTLIVVNGLNPDRLSGIQLGAAYLPQIAAAYLLPGTLIPKFGPWVGFHILVAAAIFAAIVAPVMTVRPPRDEPVADQGLPWRRPGLLLFGCAILLQYASGGAAWNYVERLAYGRGFSADTIGTVIAVSLATQVVAAWSMAWLSPKLPKWPMLLALAAAQVSFLALTAVAREPAVFGLAVCIFASMPPAMQPFQVVELIDLDPSRRAAVLTGPVMLTGNALGPLAASVLMPAGHAETSFWLAVVLMIGSLTLFAEAARRSRYGARSAQERLGRA